MASHQQSIADPAVSTIHVSTCQPQNVYKQLLFKYITHVPASLEDAIFSIAELDGLSSKDRDFLLYSYALNVDLELTRKMFDTLSRARSFFLKHGSMTGFKVSKSLSQKGE